MFFTRILSVLILLFPLHAQSNGLLDSEEARISYMVGQQIGEQLEMEMVPVETEALFQGISDYLNRAPSKMSAAEKEQTMIKYRAYKWEKEHEKLAADNLQKSTDFLAQNKARGNIRVTRSGLQYRILKKGTGPRPKITDIVSAHYSAKTFEGTELDDSFKRGTPVDIQIATVMTGLREALLLMPVGAKWEVYIPPDLGYGKSGAGTTVGPNVALIYELELLSVNTHK